MPLLANLLKIHKISNSDVLDVSKKPNFRVQNHESTSFDRSYYRPGQVHQIDTLYLPEDKAGDKFLLVAVDIGSGLMDCRPMKVLNADTTLKCLQNLYGMDGKNKNKVFRNPPLRIHADKGSEYNNKKVTSFFHNMNIGLRFASTGRHSQQAIVERMNFAIGDAIAKLQLHNENITGQEDKDWIEYIPDIVREVNKNAKETKPDLPPQDNSADVKCRGSECDIYEVGTKVRIALDFPTDVKGEKLHGKFRAGDRRFSLKPYSISNVLMFPNQPIRYVIDGVPNNTFSKAELLPYVAPVTNQLTHQKYVFEKIIGKKKERGLLFYQVKWKDYDDPTWVAKTSLVKDGASPDIKAFEKLKRI